MSNCIVPTACFIATASSTSIVIDNEKIRQKSTTDMKALRCIDIDANFVGLDTSLLLMPPHYITDLESVMISHGLIMDRTEALASRIFDDYIVNNQEDSSSSVTVVCLCVLKGGYKFFADLMERIQNKNRTNGTSKSIRMMLEFIRVKSYINTESQNSCHIYGIDNLDSRINGNNVLIVDDIVDTGKTMVTLLEMLRSYSPKSLKSCSLLLKKTSNNIGYFPNYIGFAIPEKFVVGYALDLNEHFRDLEHICVLKESSIDKYLIKQEDKKMPQEKVVLENSSTAKSAAIGVFTPLVTQV